MSFSFVAYVITGLFHPQAFSKKAVTLLSDNTANPAAVESGVQVLQYQCLGMIVERQMDRQTEIQSKFTEAPIQLFCLCIVWT
jgi:hypothetical protein